MGERILTIVHGHPDFSLGGGELAAYLLHKAYLRRDDVDDAWFLARVDRGAAPTGFITTRRDHEYLWDQGIGDWSQMRAANRESHIGPFLELLAALKPTVVHVHHYAHLGLELFAAVRRALPDATLLCTLHEYMAICRNNGQMVKTGTNALCERSSLDDCVRCFPATSPELFWLRKHRFESAFHLVDHFVSPSAFLKRRYVDWGLDPRRVDVIENGQPERATLAPRPLEDGEARNRIGFFGQINPYKGVVSHAIRPRISHAPS